MRFPQKALPTVRRIRDRFRTGDADLDGATVANRNAFLNWFLLNTSLCCLLTYLAAAGILMKWAALLLITALVLLTGGFFNKTIQDAYRCGKLQESRSGAELQLGVMNAFMKLVNVFLNTSGIRTEDYSSLLQLRSLALKAIRGLEQLRDVTGKAP